MCSSIRFPDWGSKGRLNLPVRENTSLANRTFFLTLPLAALIHASFVSSSTEVQGAQNRESVHAQKLGIHAGF